MYPIGHYGRTEVMMRGRTAAILLATGAMLALAGCGGDKPTHPVTAGHGPSAGASASAPASTSPSAPSHHAGEPGMAGQCAWVLVFQHRTYYPPKRPDRHSQHTGKPLGQAELLGCKESGSVAKQQVTVYAIPGTPPERSVITENNQVGVTDSGTGGPR